MYEELLTPPCWELRGVVDVTVVLTALFAIFDATHSLVLECSSQRADIKARLTALSDRIKPSETVVCSDTMTGLRYELTLGRPIPAGLVDLCEHHAAPEYCDNSFIFCDGRPLLLWFDFGDDQITIRPEVKRSVVQALAASTGMTFTMQKA